MQVKTIVFDMDGTLLNSSHQIPTKTLEQIKKAQNHGIQFVLASGRDKKSMIKFAKQIRIDYIIAHNGSVVYSVNQEKTLFEANIPNDMSKDIFEFLTKEKHNAIFYPNQKPLVLKESPNYDRIVEHFQTTKEIPTLDQIENVQKIIVIDFRGCDITIPLLNSLKKKYSENIEIKRSSPRAIDFNPIGISKASGIQFLSKILNIDSKSTAVFGDAGNDIEMMKWAKHSYGMSNSVDEVKKVAKVIIGDNNSGAVADTLAKIIKNNSGE